MSIIKIHIFIIHLLIFIELFIKIESFIISLSLFPFFLFPLHSPSSPRSFLPHDPDISPPPLGVGEEMVIIYIHLCIFFSFVTCSMHKNPHQNAGNSIKDTLFFKIFLGSMAPDPPRGSRAFGASRANSCPPPPPPNFYARTPMLVSNGNCLLTYTKTN